VRLSMYNYFLKHGDNLIAYNSLYKKIFKTTNSNLIKAISDLSTGKTSFIELDDEIQNILVNSELVVPNDRNEPGIAEMYYLRDIMSSRLDLTIMPTEDCNFRCKYCYESFKKGKMTDSTISGLKKFLIKNIRKYTGISVSWFGGEPLEAIDNIKNISKFVIDICKKRGIPYDSGIVTNGYNLNLTMLDELIKLRVRQIQVTLDGTKYNHDRYKVLKNGSPTYDIVLENLRSIRDNCDKRLSIVVRTNVSMDILDDLEQITSFYSNEFGKDKRFSFFFRPVGDWGGESVKKVSNAVLDKKMYSLMYERLSNCSTPLNYKMYYNELTKNVDICYAAKDNAYIIGSDGDLYKCSCKFEDCENKIGHLSDDGNMILDSNLSSKWLMAGLETSMTKCNKCILYPVCHRASCIADYVAKRTEIPTCPHMKYSLNSYLKLLADDPQYVTII